jgi:ubiquinone/menaquinone biosynthesis C-methylase UbiE
LRKLEKAMTAAKNAYTLKSQAYFDTSAAGYDQSSDMGIRPALLACILERLTDFPQPDSILDVGCGTGELLFQLRSHLNPALAGLDLSSNMLEVARKKLGSSADLRQGDAESLPWQASHFDLVFCTLSFHHYPQPLQALAEMRRVLKPGGTLLLADICMPALVNLILPLLSTGDRHFYSNAEISSLLSQAGFRAINWQKVDGSTFLVTASRP